MRDYDYNQQPEYGDNPEAGQGTPETANVHTEQPVNASQSGGFYHYGADNENINAPETRPEGVGHQAQPYQAQYPQDVPQDPNGYYAPKSREYPGGNGQESQPGNYQPGGQERPYYGGDNRRSYSYQNGSYQRTPGGNRPPKKSGSGKLIGLMAIVAVLCLLLGGVVGGLAFGKGGSETVTAPEETETPEIQSSIKEVGDVDGDAAQSQETENTLGEAFVPKTIEITTNSSGAELTPQDVYENYVNAVVAISNEGTATNVFGQSVAMASSGSGFIISKDGYIVTNNHVVEQAEKLTVMLTSGEEYEATIVGADADNDVALIKIEADDLPTVSIGDSDSISVGAQVCAIGNPLGELTNTLTVGYISALDREIRESSTTVINMFQTDCAINSGNSGGPLFDMSGNVIGITTAKPSSASSSATVEGIGFCIPINDAMDIVSDLLQYGYVTGRASLGITCQTISSTVTQYYNLPTGVYIASVGQGTAAENAGLKEGDIIISLGGVETQTVSALKLELKNHTAGETVSLHIYRSGEEFDVDVVLDEQKNTVSTTVPTQEEQEQGSGNNQNGGNGQYGYNPFYGFNPFG